jgi:pimeloyl-ACP methyl ester carboxylesterase
VYYDTGGNGPAVVCLAGLTRNARDFAELSAFLAPEFRVIRLDARGRGQSEYAKEPLAEYTIPIETRDVVDLIAYLDLKRVAFVGTSRGGIISMAIASAYHDLVSAIVLNDVGAHVEGRGLLRILATMGRQTATRSFREIAEKLKEENNRQFPDTTIEEWESHAKCIYDENDGRLIPAYDIRLKSAVAAAIDFGEPGVSLWPLFESIDGVPLLLIHGDLSDILSHDTVKQMKLNHPTMQVMNVPKQGHAPFLNTEESLRSIRRFLQSNCKSKKNENATQKEKS